MPHLTQITSAPRFSMEDEVRELEKQDKRIRQQAKSKKKDDASSEDEDRAQKHARIITFRREPEPPMQLSKQEQLDNAIKAKNGQLLLLESMRGDYSDRLDIIREEIFDLLQKKYELSLNDFNA